MTKQTNIDRFNIVVGLIFGQLYNAFPLQVELDEEAVARGLGVAVKDESPADWPSTATRILNFDNLPDGTPVRPFLYAATRWLTDEGFIRSSGPYSTEGMVLTTKALAVLNAQPDALESKLGSKLADAAGNVATEAGRAAVAETVGIVLSAATRHFFNG